MKSTIFVAAVFSSLATGAAMAGGVQSTEKALDAIVVTANAGNEIGIADSANQGTVTAKQLENRPLLRTGELLEAIPGVIVTQHSGDGKANQYFVRGFNLDHGTDFRTTVLGMPVNMPTHAHGQGYTDLNFVIPELVKSIQYKKGTYYAEEGDFSAAGAAAFDYLRVLDKGIAGIETGMHGYRRAIVANSSLLGPGHLLYAVESARQDGPWALPENYKRFNGVLSYSWKADIDEVRLTAMALRSSWNATDQVPQRAIDAGLIGRYGHVDPTDGGDTARTSLSADWVRRYADGALKANAYLIQSRLDLFSNFTYALNDPANGDQFKQSERRVIGGLNAERTWVHALGRFDSETTLGLQLRSDRLSPVGLYATAARQPVTVIREDRIRQTASGLFVSNITHWTSWFRTVAGLRADRYVFDVAGADAGKVDATIASPKLSAIFSPGKQTDIYVNWGQGFHSNDARGVTGTRDADGNQIPGATPLVRATGSEIGIRTTALAPGLQTSLSLWQLNLASELVFAGDAGTTEVSRPSRRMGIEFANYYTPAQGWIIDADFAVSRARFTDGDPAGSRIPGAIERTASAGISMERGKWSGGVRVRYFGGRPLIEDNSIRSTASTLVNLKLGYKLAKDVKLSLSVMNLFDRKVSDTDYYYQSRLPGEAAAVNDIHTHPAEPRTLRLGLTAYF